MKIPRLKWVGREPLTKNEKEKLSLESFNHHIEEMSPDWCQKVLCCCTNLGGMSLRNTTVMLEIDKSRFPRFPEALFYERIIPVEEILYDGALAVVEMVKSLEFVDEFLD